MNVLNATADLATLPGPVSLAIGVFDGVHLGHRAVIHRALEAAQESNGTAVVVTFDPHPASILRPGLAPSLLTSTRHKLKLLAGLGVAHTLVHPFDAAFSTTLPADFILSLATSCRPLHKICVGEDWAFGKARSGNLDLLRLLGSTLRFEATGIPAVIADGEAVSSTAIRAAVSAGKLEHAARLLGRPFSILGTVQPGRQLARKLDFPTANLAPEFYQLPPDGVYVASVEWEGDHYPAIANLGLRPTVEPNAKERLLEVHLFDFDRDLLGQELDVSLHYFLRAERKFDSLDALRAQIHSDVTEARGMFTVS